MLLTAQAGQTVDASRYSLDSFLFSKDTGIELLKNREIRNFYSIAVEKDLPGAKVSNLLVIADDGGRWNQFGIRTQLNPQLHLELDWSQYWGSQRSHYGILSADSHLEGKVRYVF